MKKLASKLPIQAMIANVISSATEKVAAEESKKVKSLLAYEKKEHGGHIPSVSEEEAEKTASANVTDAYIEKLASSIEFIANNFDSIEFPNKGVLQKAAEEAGSGVGPGKGPGSLEVMTAIGGTQAVSKAHSKGHNAAASQAGAALSGSHEGDGKTQLENTMHQAPGGGSIAPTARYPEKGPLVATAKTAAAKSALQRAVLQKLAGEDVLKAHISAEASANPLAGMGQLETTDATQSSPHQAGDHGGGSGNQARHLIGSNKAVIDATKRDAKGPVKSQLSEVLDEPALTSSTDSVLEDNLRNTGKAGVKIAAARTALEKVAQRGCQCETIDGECSFCKLQKVAAATKSKKASSKLADAMGMGGASMGGAPSMGGGAMTPMAEAGAGADGCTCGGTGECKICKLKAALAAAKAQGGGAGLMGGPAASPMPVEKDSMGAGTAGGVY